ncbi:MAG: class I SAM-dependent methyltransferase [Prolixibacteraceae bacterium]|nr:class I SAM-dependent methyltransferase [Prolixibacteraceae bacterium]
MDRLGDKEFSVLFENLNNFIFEDGIWYSKRTLNNVSYPETGNSSCAEVEEDSYWFNHRNNIIVAIADRFFNEKSIVDIGGGNGYVSKALFNNGFKTCIVEPGESGIIKARENGLSNLINSTFDELKLPENSLTNAGLFDVLEHIENDEDFIKELYKNIKKDGKVLIAVPAYNFLWSKADVEAGHFRRYNLKSISRLLEKSGFKIIYKSYFFFYLIPIIFLVRTIPYLLTLGKIKSRHAKKWEHNAGSNLIFRLISFFNSVELKYIKKGKRIPLGSSCIIVAEKN